MFYKVKSEEAFANNSDAMETSNHHKNGVSPKNHKSRRNLLKFIAVMFLSSCLLSVGCNDKDDENGNGIPIDPNKITASIPNASVFSEVVKVKITVCWNHDNECEIKETLAEATFNNGNFTIELTETVNTNFLHADFAVPPPTLTVSNTNAQLLWIDGITGYNMEGKAIADFWFEKVNSNSFSHVTWVYVDRDLNISGSSTYEEGSNYEEIIVYSLVLKKGWNIVYKTETDLVQGGKDIYKTEYSNSVVSGLSWFGFLWSDYESSECYIISFKDGDLEWEICNETMTITGIYPAGANLSSITPTIVVSERATVSPASGVSRNFSNGNEVTYTVTAEDGTTRVYVAKAEIENKETPLMSGSFELVYTMLPDGRNINSTVGIRYQQNSTGTTARFVIAGTENKFVELTRAEHDAIITLEALIKTYEDNVDGERGITQFDVSTDHPFRPFYFISKVSERYFLVQIISLQFSPMNNVAGFSYKGVW